MARLLGPDPSTRQAVFFSNARRWEGLPGKTLKIYTDEALTSLASIAAFDPNAPTVPGSVISGSAVAVSKDSQVPRFWFPDGYDTLWASGPGGFKLLLRADVDARLDAMGGVAVTSVAGRSGAVVLTATDIGSLGSAATKDVGTAAGTVAAGDDVRLTGAALAATGDTTGAGDTTKIQAALNSGGRVVLNAGTYWVTGLTLPTSTYLVGQGVGVTVIKLVASSNTAVVKTTNFDSLTLTGANTFLSPSGGVYDFGLSELTIDANASAQTAGWGVQIFGYNYTLMNLEVRNAFDGGLWTEWGALPTDAPAGTAGTESTSSNVRVHHNGSYGWLHLGPSDCRITNAIIFKNNVRANPSTAVGFWAMQDRVSNILSTAVSMNSTAVASFSGTINVNAATPTTFYPPAGTLTVTTSSGTARFSYTGKTTTSFTGVAYISGAGTFVTGNTIVTGNSRTNFVTNGLQLTQMHVWSNDHSWAAVLDSQTTSVNCHWEGATVGQLLVRGAANVAGGMIYDFSTIATGCGIQLGDDGNTAGLPQSVVVSANSCFISTRVSSILCDNALRAAVRWVSCSQSNVQLQNVVKTTGTYATTAGSASNGVDVSTWTVGTPGTLTVASTQMIPAGPGTLTVVTSSGTYTATFTGHNGTAYPRVAGTVLTGMVVAGSPPANSTITTGAVVTMTGIGTMAYSGTLDGGSRLSIHSNGSTTAISGAASIEQTYGQRTFDTGAASNAFRIKNAGTDQVNVNTSSKLVQLLNGQKLQLFSDSYTTQTLAIDGATGLMTGPTRNGKAAVFPGATWVPGDHAMVSWSFDPVVAQGNTVVPTAGLLYLVRVHCPAVFTATNVHLYVQAAGATLTSGQCFAGLYTSAGTLVASTADLSSGSQSFATSGAYTFPLAGGPYANQAAGDYYVGFFFNGTTGPSIVRGGNIAGNLPNALLTSGNYRQAQANTGQTTAMPSTFGTQTASGICWWAAVS